MAISCLILCYHISPGVKIDNAFVDQDSWANEFVDQGSWGPYGVLDKSVCG